MFDNYSKQLSIKDDLRYSTMQSSCEDVYIKDATPITDVKKFLASEFTKDQLILYLADNVVSNCRNPAVAVTRESLQQIRKAITLSLDPVPRKRQTPQWYPMPLI